MGSRRNTNSFKRLCMSSLPAGGGGGHVGLVVEPPTPECEIGIRYLPPPCCVLEQDTFTPRIGLVIPRKQWLRTDMTEKLFTGTLSLNKLELMFMKHYAHNRCLYIKVAKLRTGVGSAEMSHLQNRCLKISG